MRVYVSSSTAPGTTLERREMYNMNVVGFRKCDVKNDPEKLIEHTVPYVSVDKKISSGTLTYHTVLLLHVWQFHIYGIFTYERENTIWYILIWCAACVRVFVLI